MFYPFIASLFESPYIIGSIFQSGFSVDNGPYVSSYLYVADLFCMRGKAGIVTDHFVLFPLFRKILNIYRYNENSIIKSHVPISHFSGCQVGHLVSSVFPTPPYPDYLETNLRFDIIFNS